MLDAKLGTRCSVKTRSVCTPDTWSTMLGSYSPHLSPGLRTSRVRTNALVAAPCSFRARYLSLHGSWKDLLRPLDREAVARDHRLPGRGSGPLGLQLVRRDCDGREELILVVANAEGSLSTGGFFRERRPRVGLVSGLVSVFTGTASKYHMAVLPSERESSAAQPKQPRRCCWP